MTLPESWTCPGCDLTASQAREQEQRNAEIGALLEERATALAKGNEERAHLIDEQLALRGYEVAPAGWRTARRARAA